MTFYKRLRVPIVVLLLVSVLLSPAMAVSQRAEISQAPLPGAQLSYSQNFTDFRSSLPWQEMQDGIYMGPHLPVFRYQFNKVTADVRIFFNFTLAPSSFLYGAGEYYIYIPVLNSPSQIRMLIEMDSYTLVSDVPESASNVNFEDALAYGILKYQEGVGYMVHCMFVPLKSDMLHTMEVVVHFKTDVPLVVNLAQEFPQGVKATDLQFGKWLGWGMDTLQAYHSADAVPLAFAFAESTGITQNGVYSVTIGPNAMFDFALFAPRTAYPTLNMLIKPSYTSTFRVDWKWYDAVTSAWHTATHYVKASHFLVDSADGKSLNQTTAFVTVRNMQNVSSKIFLYMAAPTSSTPSARLVFDYTGPFTGYHALYYLNDFGAAHIAASLLFTDNEFVGLNTSYQASDAFLLRKALSAATYLYLEDAEKHMPILKWFLAEYNSPSQFKMDISQAASKTASALYHFKDIINKGWNFLSSLGRILWGILLKFYKWLISGFTWLWQQMQPLIQAALYIVSLFFVMYLATKFGSILQHRQEVAQ